MGEKVFLLLVYVNDIIILANDAEIDRLEQIFLEEFTWITIERNNKLSYLGMIVALEEGTATIDMTYFVESSWRAIKILSKGQRLVKSHFFRSTRMQWYC